MARINQWPLAGCLLGLLALGCSEPTKSVGVTAYQRSTELPKYAYKTAPPTTGMGKDNRITGGQEWNTGRATEPQPKALEKEFAVRGTVSSAGAGSLTINLSGGGSKSFQTDENTQVFRAGDPRFFALEGGVGGLGEGTAVSVSGYNKGGQDYARLVSVGEGGFVVPKK
jgi:hypothetical protein